jgi:sulfoacetaldehyde acetyltransferase
MGAEGYRVENPQDVQDVVEAAVRSGRPAVIDAIVDGGAEVLAEPFRRDALRMPVRHLPRYARLNAK